MRVTEVEAIIESLLFVAGEAIPLKQISQVIEEDQDTTRKILNQIKNKYEDEGRGIQIIELDGAFQMCTRPQYFEHIQKLYQIPQKFNLTQALLETLAIIAYKQPITKVQIEDLRGVRCDHVVNRLIEYNLICEAGRLDAPGRPLLFGTTKEFLRYFGFQSLEELPHLKAGVVDQIQQEVEAEVEGDMELGVKHKIKEEME
ncbi:MAG: SMC-Scp complex subunit ScpB [Epulopiscium sp.]|nr:SMC-Scp complex subunit ScpB [Candidatus Epulonipiscium sp.]